MDAFETSVGYLPLSPSLWPPPRPAIEPLPVEELLRLAREGFDADLAERLRSTGEWHWKLEVREVVEQVAATLSFGESERYERLRAALLEHYEVQYRRPTEKEWRDYLRRNVQAQAAPATASRQPGGDGPTVALYYLDDRITDRDPHDHGCSCGFCDRNTHIALGVSFYRLDLEGLRTYRDLLMDADDDSFPDWCNEQESQATVYGPNETAAVANALAYAEREGWLVVNYAERHPSLTSLVEVLGVLVGDDGYLTLRGLCSCELTQLSGEAICRVCFASLVFDVLCRK
jgi:hypothetical protein